MTREDAAKLVGIIITAYPNADKFNGDKDAITNAVNLWASVFADDDVRLVGIAVQKHIATSKWVPSVAELREIMTEITRPDLIPTDEAWLMVDNWLHSTGEYDDNSEYVFPTIIAETVRACGGKSGLWALIRQQYSYSRKAGLDKLTFIQLYEPRYQREKERAMLPSRVLSDITAVQRQIENPEYKKLENGRRYIERAKEEQERLWNCWSDHSEMRLLESDNAAGGSDYD